MVSYLKLFILFLVQMVLLMGCDMLKLTDKKVDPKKVEILKYIKEFEELVYSNGKFIGTDLDMIQNYLNLNKSIGNLEIFNENKRDEYVKIGLNLKEDFDNKYGIISGELKFPLFYEFYLPNGVVWVKPQMPLGEDIILKKEEKLMGINESFFKEKKTTLGYEILEGKLYYSIFVPIFNEKGQFIGGVKVKGDFDNFLTLMENDKNLLYIIFLYKKDAHQIEILTELNKAYVLRNNTKLSNNELEAIWDIVNRDVKLKGIYKYKDTKLLKYSLIDGKKEKLGLLIFLL